MSQVSSSLMNSVIHLGEPGRKNSKADTLSCCHDPIHQAPPKTILPPSIQLAPIRWDIMEDIQQVLQSENLLLSVLPASNMYPPTFFTKSKLVQGSFWWLSLTFKTSKACTVYAQSKSSHQLPAGLPEPLPMPQRSQVTHLNRFLSCISHVLVIPITFCLL